MSADEALATTVAAQVVQRLKDEGLVHDDRPLLTPEDAAKRLGVSIKTLRDMIGSPKGRAPRLASVRVSDGARRVEPAEIDRYLAARRLTPARGDREDPGVNDA